MLRILHITLAASVLLSTTGISISRHYCQNRLIHTAVFVKAESCGMHASGKMQKTAQMHRCDKHTALQQSACCRDALDQNNPGQFKQQVPFWYKALSTPAAVLPDWPPICLSFTPFTNGILPYLNHRPPLIAADVQVLFQVFRL
ncbi:MAG: hypothetical protein EP344_19120 [Bacteroidetes bacterium]|nr:MAG: hypothetical protein EP344_19120 [Bacteroidota bacterium]